MLIFDIGANIGKYSDEILKCFPDCKIILVEANVNLAKTLEEKYKTNPNIIIENVLLSNKNGNETFYICNVDTISTANLKWVTDSRFANQSNFVWKKEEVVSTTLDSLIFKYSIPDIIKIDVEGYEFEVISGLTQKIQYYYLNMPKNFIMKHVLQ